MLKLRNGLERSVDDPCRVDYSKLAELPPLPAAAPPPERPVARANFLALRQAHKTRKMLGSEAPTPRSAPVASVPSRPSPALPPKSPRLPSPRPSAANSAPQQPQASSPPPPLPPKPSLNALKKISGRSPPAVRRSADKNEPPPLPMQQQAKPSPDQLGVQLIQAEDDPFAGPGDASEDEGHLVY